MKRRDAIRNVVLLMGSALTVSSLSVFNSGCAPSKKPESGVFSADDKNFFNTIGDIIIPQTDSPGAKEAGVGAVIAVLLEDCYQPEDREKVLKCLKEIENLGIENFDKQFTVLNLDQQTSLIGTLDSDAYTFEAKDQTNIHQGYKIIKELTMLSYFTSEPGTTQALNYIMTPGRFDGCVDLKLGQKAWA